MKNNFDRLETPYYKYRYSDAQDREVKRLSTCAGCNKAILSGDEILILFDGLNDTTTMNV
jgi:hypothetical protein